jgi:hypothetical protein
MTQPIPPQESDDLKTLYLAGAHSEALGRAFGRDPRAVRAALRREGVALRRESPLPRDWQTALPLPARQGLQHYCQELQACHQVAWQRLTQTALTTTATGPVFPSQEVYEAVLATARPPESPLDVARRLGVELTVVLLAAAEGLEQQEALGEAPGPGTEAGWHRSP